MTARRAPGPCGLGSLRELRQNRLRFVTGLQRAHGPVARFDIGPMTAHLVTDPAGVKHVLQDHNKNYTKKTRGFAKLKPLLGEGLLTSDGEFWLRQRRIAQPAFHKDRVAGFGELMARVGGELVESWQPKAQAGAPVDVLAELMGATLRVVALSLLSTEVGHETGRVGKALTVALTWANDQLTRVVPIPRAVPTRTNREANHAVRVLNEVVGTIIAERRRAGDPGQDLLGMLMSSRDPESGEGMTDVQLRDEVMTIFLAGHETTANLLAWSFVLLSQNPGEARRLHAEVDALGHAPTMADFPRLPHTRRVLDEALRLFPPAWSFGRAAIEDDEIGGYRIPKGTLVILNPYLTHRLPEHWDNPEGFDPDRFLPDHAEARARYAYFPFGGGPRLCIGQGFALMEGVLLLAAIAQRYRVDLLPGHVVEPEPSITLRPAGGLPMRIVAR